MKTTDPRHIAYQDKMVPCIVCGADVPEQLGVCPGPMDGSSSECERQAVLLGNHPKLSAGDEVWHVVTTDSPTVYEWRDFGEQTAEERARQFAYEIGSQIADYHKAGSEDCFVWGCGDGTRGQMTESAHSDEWDKA